MAATILIERSQRDPNHPRSEEEPMPDAIRNVLAATDFSEPADLGLAWAAHAARAHGARLHVVHVLTPPMPVADFAAPPLTLDQELRDAARKRMDEVLAGEGLAGLDANGVLRDGTPSQSVLDVADEVAADLVVVGTRGLTGFRHLLLGSTAERIVQRAKTPVLAVHPGDPRPERTPRTVLVPTDFSQDAEAALAAANRCLALTEEGTRVILLHVFHVPAEYRSYGLASSVSRMGEEMISAVRERLEELAKPLRSAGTAVEVECVQGIPAEVIVRVAKERKVDLIAMGTHGRSGVAHLLLGSTAERVVQHAACPVLTVRRPAE
jgi:nucleotide-binding universal stress UspA family protein